MKKKLFLKFFVLAVIGAFVTFTSCKDYDDDINKLQSELNSLRTDLTSKIDAAKSEMTSLINSEIAAVNTALNAAKDRLTAAEGKLTALETAQNATQAELTQAKADITQAKADIATLTTKVGVLEAFQTKAEGDLEDLKGRVSDLEENSATKTELAAVELELTTKIGEINTALGLLDGRVESLETLYAELLEKHDEDVAELLTEISEAEGRVTVRILALEELLKLNEDGESEVLDEIYQLIQENADEIEAVKEDLEEKYDELIEITEDLQDQIDAIEGRVTVNEGAIEDLQGRMKTAEDDIKEIVEVTIPELDTKLSGMINNVLKIVKNRLTAISLAPNLYVGGIEAIEFTSISYNCIDDKNENKALPTANPNKYTSAPVTATYKFNPRTFNLANADYQYVDRQVEVRAAGLPASKLVNIEGAPVYKPTDGTVNFTLRRQNAHINQPTAPKQNFITLEATLKGDAVDEGEEGVVIAAHQELVEDILLSQGDLHLGDNASNNKCGTGFTPYAYTFNAAKAFIVYDDMVYNEVFDLGSRVRACFGGVEYDVEDFNLTYRFSMPTSKYEILEGSTITDQQTYFELVDGEKGLFKAVGFNKEAIGRTPIFKVEVIDANGCIVRRAFVKVEVGVKKSDDVTLNSVHDLAYQCDETATHYEYDVPTIREQVYRILETSTGHVSISHEEFWNIYDLHSSTVTKNGVAHPMSVPQIVDGPTTAGVATKEVHWDFTHSELGSIGKDGSVFVATLTVKNKLVSSEFPQYVNFVFTVNVNWPDWTLDKVENEVYWTFNADGTPVWYNVNVATPQSKFSPASQAIFKTSLPQAYSKYDLILDPAAECEGAVYKYEIIETYSDGEKTSPKLSGVFIDQVNDPDYIQLDKSNAAVKAALNSAGGLQAVVQHWYELDNGDKWVINTFVVNFVRPVNLNMPSGVTVKDATTGGDVADFHWNGILTDWRGEPIVEPSWVWTTGSMSYWHYNYTPEFEWVDGHYVEVSPASVSLVTEQVSFTVGGTPVDVYEGEATFVVQRRNWVPASGWGGNHVSAHWGNWFNTSITQTVSTPDQMLTQAQVDMYLDSKKFEFEVNNKPADVPFSAQYQVVETNRNVTQDVMTTGQTISFTNVIGINYTPAVYDWVPGNWVPVPHVPTMMPPYEGTHDGQIVGDWVWTTVTWPQGQYDPGQYWDFYGPFGTITAHVSEATTNLAYNNYQLPTDVTLTQSGNTITYVNVGAPVGQTYEIYVPVTVTYGWGEVSAVFTITVEPSI